MRPSAAAHLYTDHADDTGLEQAIQAGANRYLLKSDPHQQLLTALRTVYAGETVIRPTLADEWAKLQHRPNTADPIEALSSRERQVKQLVASGQSNPLIPGSLQDVLRCQFVVQTQLRHLLTSAQVRIPNRL